MMNEEEKYKWLDEMSKLTIRVGQIESQTRQAFEYMAGMNKILQDIWDAGYSAGKKAWAKDLNKN
jgi:hypothetical protein